MAKAKGGASGFGAGDNVHSGKGSKSGKGSAGSATEKSHNVEFAKGGNTPMFSEQAAESEIKNGMAGHTADPSAKDSAPGDKFASGGSGKMFSFNPAVTARSGITSAR